MNINSISNNMQMQNASLQRMATQGDSFEQTLQSAIKTRDTSEVRAAAEEMESFFINKIFQSMRRTVPEPQGIFSESNAQRMWREMMDEQTAQNLANSGGIGLADMIYEQLTRTNSSS